MWEVNLTTKLLGSGETPSERVFKRVGHKGAGLIEPGNTLASFDAALNAGVDMIEFDVVRQRRSGRLMIAHGRKESHRHNAVTLEAGLGYLASDRFDQIELAVDLKLPGYEAEVVEALRRHGLVERTLVCSQFPWSLSRVRKMESRLRLGWSILGIGDLPENGRLGRLRQSLNKRAAAAVAEGKCHSIMAHWRTATPELIEAVRAAGGDVYAWTVDEASRIEQLAAFGVAGVISNDPRLFDSLGGATA